MKKLIGITGAILLVYVILSAALVPSAQSPVAASKNIEPGDSSAPFTARAENDRIVIYEGEVLLMKTDIRVSQLPKTDRIRLREGIELFSEKELKQFIEDYCS